MKFEAGDEIDLKHCTVLTHEFFRCDDSFKQFQFFGEQLILKRKSRELSYKAYNSYADFIHHLYEFMLGCYARDNGDTKINKKNNEERIKIIEQYITRHTQRVLDQFRDTIKNGTAPSWVNYIDYYDVIVPPNFAPDFRKYRNKVVGHVTYERASELSLSEFYKKYHKFLYCLYQDSYCWWGKKDKEFPDLKEITDFSLLINN
ncbi:MAG: hypothetical protein ACI86H_002199 [bacterium]